MSEQLAIPLPSRVDKKDGQIDLLDLFVLWGRNKWLLFGTPIVCGLLALLVSFMIAPIFTSTATILPPQQQQSSGMAAMLGQLGGLAGAAGGLAGLKSPNYLYLGLLESRTVADKLIARFALQSRYHKKTMDATRKQLEENSVIAEVKKGGFITIIISDEEAKFAAELANAYVDELTKLTQTMALTEASQRRMFFEKQLKEARDQLSDAEIELRETQEKTGMIRPDSQVQAIITTVAQLKGTIAAKEIQRRAMRTFATEKNPELLRLEEELGGMKAQLAKLETNPTSKEGDFMVPVGKIPQAGVEYVRGMRNVKYYETIFELLAKQFELAKIDEAKDSSLIQILDKAIPAEHKSKPSRAIITILGALAGALLGIVLVMIRSAYGNSQKDAESRRRWQELRLAWKGAAAKEKLPS